MPRPKLEELRGIWRGRTVACIASGPSLTQSDCDAVRATGLPAIVVNTSFRMAPWADILYAMDAAWWRQYGAEVTQLFRGRKVSYVPDCGPDVIATKAHIHPAGFGNSGSYAISLAIYAKAARIILLGYDCRYAPDGRRHWHADHPAPMGNAASIKKWPAQFLLVSKYAVKEGAKVVNCSRDTALTCFERGTLERELSCAATEIERV